MRAPRFADRACAEESLALMGTLPIEKEILRSLALSQNDIIVR